MTGLSIRSIVLASNSASRKAMLGAAGVDFEAIGADVDERGGEATAGAIRAAGGVVTWEGHPWTFRVRGVILSTTPYNALAQTGGKFGVFDRDLDLPPPVPLNLTQRG